MWNEKRMLYLMNSYYKNDKKMVALQDDFVKLMLSINSLIHYWKWVFP